MLLIVRQRPSAATYMVTPKVDTSSNLCMLAARSLSARLTERRRAIWIFALWKAPRFSSMATGAAEARSHGDASGQLCPREVAVPATTRSNENYGFDGLRWPLPDPGNFPYFTLGANNSLSRFGQLYLQYHNFNGADAQI